MSLTQILVAGGITALLFISYTILGPRKGGDCGGNCGACSGHCSAEGDEHDHA